MIDPSIAILATQKLIALAIIFQTIEYILIKKSYADDGVWRWQSLAQEFKIFSINHQNILEFFLKYKNFILLLWLRLILALLLLFYSNSIILGFLLFSTIMISLRWRGTFNGGSDYVTVLVLASLTAGSLFNYSEKSSLTLLWYIAIQVVSSYFISGLVKIRRKNWRNGVALSGFTASTIYNDNSFTKLISSNKKVSIFFSWTIMIFEILFIFSFLDPKLCLLFMSVAFLFHIGNFYIFGLNRFIFAWISCYPALLFCSGYLNML